jgi:hypothetical protein
LGEDEQEVKARARKTQETQMEKMRKAKRQGVMVMVDGFGFNEEP